MHVLEHVAARERLDPYRAPESASGGSLVAIARRADASRWMAVLLTMGTVITGGVLVASLSLYLFLPLQLTVLVPMTAVLGGGAGVSIARAIARLRLEIRGARVVARTGAIVRRAVVVEAAEVRAIDVLEVARPKSGADEVALVARLADERVIVLLEPLSLEDARAMRELASSALGIARAA